jgi:dTDP-4-amino-4,6-dideoxy-D-galactose acyltransferase
MFQIERLSWDTEFFGYPVGKLILNQQFSTITAITPDHDCRLIYILSENKIDNTNELFPGSSLVDIKIEFIKSTESLRIGLPNNTTTNIREIKEISEKLMGLVYESGIHSRFRTDINLSNNEFERLYHAWITKALTENNAWVFGAFDGENLLGFVSLFKKFNDMDIALIAVDSEARGRHIGRTLLEKAHHMAVQEHCSAITVVTQESNEVAMNFYNANGFKMAKRTFIYHWWK